MWRVEGNGGGESFKECEYVGRRNKVVGEEKKWRRTFKVGKDKTIE